MTNSFPVLFEYRGITVPSLSGLCSEMERMSSLGWLPLGTFSRTIKSSAFGVSEDYQIILYRQKYEEVKK